MEIMDTKEYEMVSRRFSDLKESEQLYLTLHLLGSRMQSIPVDFMEEESGQESQWLSRILVKAFSRIAGVGFSKERELTEALAAHLKTSMYRYRYGVQLANPMLDNIKMSMEISLNSQQEPVNIWKKKLDFRFRKVKLRI